MFEMEVNEADKIVIAKPIASRPSSSSFGSFTDLLSDAIDGSTPLANERSETEVSAIRPKIVRPAINRAPLSPISPAESSGVVTCSSSDKVATTEKQSVVVFRPLAKVVSRATFSLLATMGNFDIDNPQAPTQVDDQDKGQLTLKQPSESLIEPSKMASQMPEDKRKITASSLATADRLSSDGYNWRKYGQKQVKGSEYPRSYYKCTDPDCTVKKKVERSLDGEVAEIVYKGDHNHPKPPLPKRTTSGVQGQEQDNNKPDPNENVPERNNGKSELLGNSEICDGLNDDSKSKRRKHVSQKSAVETSERGLEETRMCVQNNAEPEIMGDGFRWRKYGQKVVKGNPHPRSYYRCTNLKCNVRKHVERALDDPSAFITTYEGKHNHERP